MSIPLSGEWGKYLGAEFSAPYMQSLREFLLLQKRGGQCVLPENKNVFKAFQCTAFNDVKVVILGQDPYHGIDKCTQQAQAHGLAFSVPKNVRIPPSLKNIYLHLYNDLHLAPAAHGDLSAWASQGVLLLNTVLTVNKGEAGSHQHQGWERFTDKAISVLADNRQNLVFMLWGRQAQQKKSLVVDKNHLILQSVHPSPLSAHRGFLLARHFSQANNYLRAHQIQPIDWSLQ